MQELSIIVAPDARLKDHAQAVQEVNADIVQLMDAMLNTMHDANGIGLAAPQVGILKRVIVADVSLPDEPEQPICLANPEIVWRSDNLATGSEGCLSLPISMPTLPVRQKFGYATLIETTSPTN